VNPVGNTSASPGRSTSAGDDLARQRELVLAQREELSRTIQVLADKVDVPARAREAAATAKARIGAAGRRYTRPEYTLSAVALVSAALSLVAFTIWRRRR
jgi:Protein of unknown function (DUF3618)